MKLTRSSAARAERARRVLRERKELKARRRARKDTYVEGEIMRAASRGVVSVAPTTPVFEVVRLVEKHGYRRYPVIDPGRYILYGIITVTDIVDFFGGGARSRILSQRHHGDFYSAIREPVRTIMTTEVVTVNVRDGVRDAWEIMREQQVGGLPVIDDSERVWAIVTERDILRFARDRIPDQTVEEAMTKEVITVGERARVQEAMHKIVKTGFRRLPVVKRKKLTGILTATDIVRFLARDSFSHLRKGTVKEVLRTPVREVMIGEVYSITPTATLRECFSSMEEYGVGCFPVVDPETQRLIGIVTERDLLERLEF